VRWATATTSKYRLAKEVVMAELIIKQPDGTETVIQVDVSGVGWVTEPGGPGPDSPEAQAFTARQAEKKE